MNKSVRVKLCIDADFRRHITYFFLAHKYSPSVESNRKVVSV